MKLLARSHLVAVAAVTIMAVGVGAALANTQHHNPPRHDGRHGFHGQCSPAKVARNKANVVAYYTTAFNDKKPEEAVARYGGPVYIQHNPQVTSGLAPVMKFFGSRPSSPIPDRKSWKTQVVSVVADDDLVVVAFRREMDDPRKPGAKYTTTWFDMWRIKDGKATEHWDYGTIAPPAAPAK